MAAMADANQIESAAEFEAASSGAEEAIARIARAMQRARGNPKDKSAWGGGMFLVGAVSGVRASVTDLAS